jgi:hypothetical protein
MASADSSVDISAARQSPAEAAQHAVVADFDGVGTHMGQRPQRVHAFDGLDSSALGVEHHPLFTAVDGHRQHCQHGGLGRGGHRPHLRADDQAVAVPPGGGQPGVDRIGGDHLAGRPRR